MKYEPPRIDRTEKQSKAPHRHFAGAELHRKRTDVESAIIPSTSPEGTDYHALTNFNILQISSRFFQYLHDLCEM